LGCWRQGANVLGGLILVKSGAHRNGERFLKYLVALAPASCWRQSLSKFCPKLSAIWIARCARPVSTEAVAGAMDLAALGYLCIQFFEHTLAPHFHFGAENSPGIVPATLLGLHCCRRTLYSHFL
jgi:hypothetical protein